MSDRSGPLPTAAIHILLALGPGPRHGYAIMTEVMAMTGGAVRLAPGTLYTNIKRLLGNGLIEEVAAAPESMTDERRRYYRLTPAGQEVAVAEVARMRLLLGAAQPWLPGPDE